MKLFTCWGRPQSETPRLINAVPSLQYTGRQYGPVYSDSFLMFPWSPRLGIGFGVQPKSMPSICLEVMIYRPFVGVLLSAVICTADPRSAGESALPRCWFSGFNCPRDIAATLLPANSSTDMAILLPDTRLGINPRLFRIGSKAFHRAELPFPTLDAAISFYSFWLLL
ncbi:hypothetical protein CPB83DRAFT_846823 [Crepidotus variabilis]|uniref:Uncharacterized protein n=1 Tax=Crepidotus variabilis TaxID=179855 RepID=A0A9P6JU04_9AGAR|nr:hypothetical protein CPB83DRAFT_846823 [Crepidotus variabilis]